MSASKPSEESNRSPPAVKDCDKAKKPPSLAIRRPLFASNTKLPLRVAIATSEESDEKSIESKATKSSAASRKATLSVEASTSSGRSSPVLGSQITTLSPSGLSAPSMDPGSVAINAMSGNDRVSDTGPMP